MSERMERLLTPQEVAERLAISVQTLYNRRSYGGDLPPAVHIGRLVRYRQQDVDAWILGLSRHPAVSDAQEFAHFHEKPIRRGRPTKAEQVRNRARQHR